MIIHTSVIVGALCIDDCGIGSTRSVDLDLERVKGRLRGVVGGTCDAGGDAVEVVGTGDAPDAVLPAVVAVGGTLAEEGPAGEEDSGAVEG